MSVESILKGVDAEIDGVNLPDDTEDGLALEFVSQHPNFRWIEAWSRWYAWDNKVWKHDDVLSMYSKTRQFLRRVANRTDEKASRVIKKAATVAAVEKLARCDD